MDCETEVRREAESTNGLVQPGRIILVAGLLGGLVIGGFLGRSIGDGSIDSEFSSNPQSDWGGAQSEGNLSPLPSSHTVSLEPVPLPTVRPVDGEYDSLAPLPLMMPDNAAPLARVDETHDKARQENPLLDALLESELPHTNQAEREIWIDVLQGLPLDDAREIVRMRKRLSTGPLVGPLRPQQKPSTAKRTANGLSHGDSKDQHFRETYTAFDRASLIWQHNIANMDVPGFLPGRPVLAEAANAIGATFVCEEIRADEWTAVDTGRSADVTPARGTFVAVSAADGINLTTLGRLVVVDGAVAVDFGHESLPVYPEVRLEEGASLDDAISRIQLWSVEAPAYLERKGGGRFGSTSRSGQPVEAAGKVTGGSLAVGSVDVEASEKELKLLDVRRVMLGGASVHR